MLGKEQNGYVRYHMLHDASQPLYVRHSFMTNPVMITKNPQQNLNHQHTKAISKVFHVLTYLCHIDIFYILKPWTTSVLT